MLTGLRTRQERTFRMSRGTTFRTTRLTKTSSPLNNWTNVILLAGAGGLEPPNGGIKIRRAFRIHALKSQKDLPKIPLFHVACCKEKPSVFNELNLPQAARRDMVATWSARQRQSSRHGVLTRLSTTSCGSLATPRTTPVLW